jgi:hypothetical protein
VAQRLRINFDSKTGLYEEFDGYFKHPSLQIKQADVLLLEADALVAAQDGVEVAAISPGDDAVALPDNRGDVRDFPAAFFARAVRSAGVMVSRDRLPPILPPSRPVSLKNSSISVMEPKFLFFLATPISVFACAADWPLTAKGP